MMTSVDVTIRCGCGAVRGLVDRSAGNGNRAVCYCDDCQLFAHFMDRPDEVLDAWGGSDVFQVSPSWLRITAGADRLACMRLTPKGMLRWYTDCCGTPIGNTPATGKLPIVGLIHSCIDAEAAGRTLDALLGPVRARVFARYARGEPTGPAAHPGVPVTEILRIVARLAVWRLRGDQRRSPFFDARSGGRPIAAPRVLTAAELAELRSARSRWMQRAPAGS